MIIVKIEFDQVNKFSIHNNWIQALCQTILNDNGHNEATITIIFSNDSIVTLYYSFSNGGSSIFHYFW